MATGQFVKIKTIASLFPLFAEVPDAQRAARLRAHAMNPKEFNTLFPMPSVARDDPQFEKDCWRGPVWINTAYMAIAGLRNYGYEDDAAELAWKLVDGVYRNYALTGKIVEFYDPDRDGFKELHRKRGNLYKRLTLGDKPQPNFVGWTGLVNTMLIQDLIGLRKQGGKRELAPRFPDSAQGASFTLSLPSEDLAISISVLAKGKTQCKVTSKSGVQEFSLERGEKKSI
jgi:glycogen debranching enzyme